MPWSAPGSSLDVSRQAHSRGVCVAGHQLAQQRRTQLVLAPATAPPRLAPTLHRLWAVGVILERQLQREAQAVVARSDLGRPGGHAAPGRHAQSGRQTRSPHPRAASRVPGGRRVVSPGWLRCPCWRRPARPGRSQTLSGVVGGSAGGRHCTAGRRQSSQRCRFRLRERPAPAPLPLRLRVPPHLEVGARASQRCAELGLQPREALAPARDALSSSDKAVGQLLICGEPQSRREQQRRARHAARTRRACSRVPVPGPGAGTVQALRASPPCTSMSRSTPRASISRRTYNT